MLNVQYGGLFGLVMVVGSVIILQNDLRNRRSYEIGDTSRFIISQDRHPILFRVKIVCVALCTAFVLVTSIILLLTPAAADQFGATSRGVVVAVIPWALVIMHVFGGTSARVFARQWDGKEDGPLTLGLSSRDNRNDSNDQS